MSLDQKLRDLRDAIQVDVGNRGLARDPSANLFNACADDFAHACRSLAEHPAPVLGVVTGFFIPAAQLGETDGPLGAVYLARTLPALGIRVLLASDPFCRASLQAGLQRCGLGATVPILDLPSGTEATQPDAWWRRNDQEPPSHLLAIERVGPAHTPTSIRAQADADEETVQRFRADVSAKHHGRCHTMRGVDITDSMSDAEFAFAATANWPVTIGVGDGGNEIGMGKIPWDVIRRNIPGGAVIACRVATDHLIVAGVSNWGAYALAAGVALVRGVVPPAEWFDLTRERAILTEMVEKGPLVDGVSGQRKPHVDGLAFEEYAQPLRRIGEIARS